MNLASRPTPGRHPPTQRLGALHTLVRQAHPQARVHAVEECGCGFPGFEVELPNGIGLVVGVDIDLPFALFEVVRTHAPREAPRFRFEAFDMGGFAGSGHLSTDAVLALLRQYATAPRQQAPRRV